VILRHRVEGPWLIG